MSGSGSSSTQYTSFCANGRWAGSSLAAAGVAGAVVQARPLEGSTEPDSSGTGLVGKGHSFQDLWEEEGGSA